MLNRQSLCTFQRKKLHKVTNKKNYPTDKIILKLTVSDISLNFLYFSIFEADVENIPFLLKLLIFFSCMIIQNVQEN
jgi:hypothetical protein